MALRSRIVLACVEGRSNKEVAAACGVSQPTVGKWRRRFCELDGLCDDPRPGRPPSISVQQGEEHRRGDVGVHPENATHWSRAKMAQRSGLSASTIGRIWRTFDPKQHRAKTFKLSNDPLIVEKVYDIVGLPQSRSPMCSPTDIEAWTTPMINGPHGGPLGCAHHRRRTAASLWCVRAVASVTVSVRHV